MGRLCRRSKLSGVNNEADQEESDDIWQSIPLDAGAREAESGWVGAEAAGLKNLRVSRLHHQFRSNNKTAVTQPSKFLQMETRELKKLADEATGLMAEAAVKASVKVKPGSMSVLERHQLRTFSALAGKLSVVHITL